MVMIVFIYVWKYCGFCVILFTAGIANVSQSLYESARLDGAKSHQLVTKITIPMIAPTTFFVFLMELIYSFKIFREVFALFGDYQTPMCIFAEFHQQQLLQSQLSKIVGGINCLIAVYNYCAVYFLLL